MNSVSQANANAYGLHNRAALSNNSSASSSSELYVNSYSSLDAGLTIQTREGDVVTLSTPKIPNLKPMNTAAGASSAIKTAMLQPRTMSGKLP